MDSIDTNLGEKSLVSDLIQCRDLAFHLRSLLGNMGLETQENLAGKIFQSLADVIIVMESTKDVKVQPDSPLSPASLQYFDDRKRKNSRQTRQVYAEEKKGGGKRKHIDTWTETTPNPHEDGRGWRKYGQKEILGAKYPRCYFRCTHRNDQNCFATKKVQAMDDNPSLFQVSYTGKHTCKDLTKAPQLILENAEDRFVLQFQSNSKSSILPHSQTHIQNLSNYQTLDDMEFECFKNIYSNDFSKFNFFPETKISPSISDGSETFPLMYLSDESFGYDIGSMPDSAVEDFLLI